MLAAHHRKQIANHTGKLKGEPIHPALYSVVNENEEVRATTWCLTKAMPFVQGLYKGIEKGLREHGHQPTQVVYCDQPQGMFYYVFFSHCSQAKF